MDLLSLRALDLSVLRSFRQPFLFFALLACGFANAQAGQESRSLLRPPCTTGTWKE